LSHMPQAGWRQDYLSPPGLERAAVVTGDWKRTGGGTGRRPGRGREYGVMRGILDHVECEVGGNPVVSHRISPAHSCPAAPADIRRHAEARREVIGARPP